MPTGHLVVALPLLHDVDRLFKALCMFHNGTIFVGIISKSVIDVDQRRLDKSVVIAHVSLDDKPAIVIGSKNREAQGNRITRMHD